MKRDNEEIFIIEYDTISNNVKYRIIRVRMEE